jgi:hypothetical protein
MTEVTLIPDPAETLYVSHPVSSYGIFCFNSKGDLFLNSDYGFYGFAWRHFGDNGFKDFLAQCNSEYILSKFEINMQYVKAKKLVESQKKHLRNLIDELIKYCKTASNG